MPYSNADDFGTWSSVTISDLGTTGYNYANTVAKLIEWADRAIDDYLDQPHGFFEPGGVAIQHEYHDGMELLDTSKEEPLLILNYKPVLSVAKFEEETGTGTWTTRTEGTGNDYKVAENGVRILSNIPDYDWKNVKVTYIAGYRQTPGRINECSARLAAAMAHRIIDSRSRAPSSMAGMTVSSPENSNVAKEVFDEELKLIVRGYKRVLPVKLL